MSTAPTARYPIPAGPVRTELAVERSRFIASLAHAASIEQARGHIAAVAGEFADATHNCWAYLIGPPGTTAQIGLSDDGEPHGTAGRPMLNMLLHSGLGDTAVVVTRYFGGVKLGTGGLSRAYSGAVAEALAIVVRIECITWRRLTLTLDYSILEAVRREFARFEVEQLAEVYTDRVRLTLRVPADKQAAFIADVIDRSHGQALIEELPEDAV